LIRILIVDDSAFMRKVISDLFFAEPDFQVIDSARNGAEAVEKVISLSPDVVTMDLEMPVMDGLSALQKIMMVKPTPVVMVSSLTKAGGDSTVRGLEAGAVDFVAKTAGPISRIDDIAQELVMKCRAASKVNMSRVPVLSPRLPAQMPPNVLRPTTADEGEPKRLTKPTVAPTESILPTFSGMSSASDWIVAIGTSTGGPRALQEVLTRLPKNLPCPAVIVQHMPPGFTRSLAERLNSLSEIQVKEAEEGDVLLPGCAVIAPGDYHISIQRESGKSVVRLNKEPAIGGLRPAVDPMMMSVSRNFPGKAVGVILTGMGHDGAKGLLAIKQAHGCTIAEDKSTTVIYGMPKAAVEAGAVDRSFPLHEVAAGILQCLRNGGLK
jgi:two-component system, chemotaxis family, protein-glutamate methylesterase/glutaminase